MKSRVDRLAKKLSKQGLNRLADRLAQATNPNQVQIDSPSVQIDPSIQADVQEAVNELQKMDSGFFKGVSKIVALTGGAFGQVVSTDPTVINVNLVKIKQQVQQQMGSNYNSSDPKSKEVFKEALKRALVETISHEKAHVSDFDPEQHKFPGGEGVAESAERNTMQKLYQGKPIEAQAQVDEDEFSKSLEDMMEEMPQEALEAYDDDASKIERNLAEAPQEFNKDFDVGERVTLNIKIPNQQLLQEGTRRLDDKTIVVKVVRPTSQEISNFRNSEDSINKVSKKPKYYDNIVWIERLEDKDISEKWHPKRMWVYSEELEKLNTNTKYSQVAVPPSSGQGVDNYNRTGNDYMAGGANAVPMSTRLQELYKKYRKKKKTT